MTGVDYAVLVIVGLSLLIGFKRGFIREFFPLVSLIAALVIAFFSYDHLARLFAYWWFPRQSDFDLLGYEFSLDSVARFSFFILVFVLIMTLGSVLTSLMSKLVQSSVISGFDRFFGLLFGGLRAALIIMILTLLGGLAGMSDRDWWRQSVFMPTVEKYSVQFLPPGYSEKFNRPSSRKEETKVDV